MCFAITSRIIYHVTMIITVMVLKPNLSRSISEPAHPKNTPPV